MAPPASEPHTASQKSAPVDRALQAGIRLSSPEPGEEVVISGLSGQFPESTNVYEFRDKLLNKVDLVTEDDRRWKKDNPEIPQRTGKINDIHKFDASFFGVHYKQAHTMDPMCRMLMEKAYEAVVDAGLNPRQLRGTKTGVFVGACFSESEKTWFYEKLQVNGFGITGCSRAMLSNRISYWLGTNGPSYTIDTACSSSLYALEHAYKAIREGHCEAALVGGCNLCLHPLVSLQFFKLGVLSPEGKCRTFDADSNGYVRSEAVGFVFLQKSKDAKRIYCRMVHGKTNCDGFKEQGITFPSTDLQARLMGDFYKECRYKPSDLTYIEAHGTGTPIGDPAEIQALENVFLENRTKPLLVGSVKSNMGHSEPASGICSLAKIIIAFETGFIPPNLHYTKPRPDMKALVDGRMKVVSEKTPLEGDLIAVNSFGFGGANCHALLERNKKKKINKGQPSDDLPRLIAVSGRTEEAINVILDDLESRPLDAEFARLIHDVHSEDIPGHVYRGYSLLECAKDGGPAVKISRDRMYFSGARRPVCFVFSGMGSQWPAMGAQLMRLPIFAAAIEKCHRVLQPRGVNLTEILTNPDPTMFDNILHSFVGIAAVQVGLVDIIRALGIEPDLIIGHSVGELGCAYADGCFTAEEMVLSAYSRGLASIETELIRGSMAAVGVGYKTIKDLCPPGIEVACHNGPDSSTISGPAEQMKTFVAELQAKGIFAREVPCSNIAYHSKYIASAGPTLLKYLKQVIPEPKPRSSKWLSSSVPQDKWNEEAAKYSSPEYHTNNLLSAVLFEETSRLIPDNAITIEIAPHGLLQAILKRSLKKDVTNIALTRRGDKDNVQVLLNGIGKLFEVGLNPKISILYPEIQFPVSCGTPMLSPLIRWEHSDDWYLITYCTQERIRSGERQVNISLQKEGMEYLKGHVIDGRNLYPATGYLYLVWESLAIMRNESPEEYSAIFENVKFLRATNLPTGTDILQIIVMIQRGTGNFEIIEGGAAIVSGRVRAAEDEVIESVDFENPGLQNGTDAEDLPLKSKDIYKEFRLRGYNYSGLFRGLISANSSGTVGRLRWVSNYTAFMDNMLQMQLLGKDTRDLYVPTEIQSLTIDVPKHKKFIENLPDDNALEVHYYPELGILKSGGIEIRGLTARSIPKKKIMAEPVLENYQFVTHFENGERELADIARINAQLVLENKYEIKVKLAEQHNPDDSLFITEMVKAFNDLPLVRTEAVVTSASTQDELNPGYGITVVDKHAKRDTGNLVFIGRNILQDEKLLKMALAAIIADGYIISRESKDFKATASLPEDLQIITSQIANGEKILMLNRKKALMKPTTLEIRNDDVEFKWLPKLQKLIGVEKNIILYSQYEPTSGILGLVNCLRREPGGNICRCVFILDKNAPKFNADDAFYKGQLDLALPFNVYNNGAWGSYRHLLFNEAPGVKVEHAYVNTLTRADLSSLRWVEGPLSMNSKVDPGNVLIQIYYSALNFRDVMVATGKLSHDVVSSGRLTQDCVQGFEFSGKTRDGRRIMGISPSKAISTAIVADELLIWEIPDAWTLEEAATIPVVYATVYYAMVLVGKIKRGMKVLIHAGSGGVGQAAINVALFYGCEVFTTVGTKEKRDFIKKRYPQIDDAHIGNSRDTTFEQLVLAGTRGNGVDMVLNSLSEEKLQASVRCLARQGKFLEIGKYDLANNNPLGMGTFLKETSFKAIMLDYLFFHNDVQLKKELNNLLSAGVKSGAVKPLPTTVFQTDEVEKAYKYIGQGKHIGKVLIKVRDEETGNRKKCLPVPRMIEAKRRFFCNAEDSYIICGGLGGFGLELVDWLVLRGARRIVLTSRRGISDGYQSMRVRVWRNYGATVIVKAGNFTSEEGAIELIKEANNVGPVAAIFNLAVVLRDAILENQTVDSYLESFTSKAKYTMALDKVSRKLCPKLRHFVVFSSVVAGRGNGGQTNYGLSNSVMERICEQRRKDGLPGIAIQWGAIGEVGLVAEMQEAHAEGEVFDLEIGGTLQQRVASCLQAMDEFLTNPTSAPVVSSIVVAEKREHDLGTTILEVIGNLLGVKDPKSVGLHTTLSDLGMDSMTGVEVKQALEREFEIFLSPAEIRHLTFGRLKDMSDQREAKQSVSMKIDIKDFKLEEIGIYMKNLEDELVASKPIVRLPSKLDNGKDTEDSGEAIFFIPGVEGVASTMKSLAANLDKQVLGLQTNHEETTTVENVAKLMYTVMAPRLRGRSSFHVVGYSMGTTSALELCRLLESAGYRGRLTFLDGAPDFIRRLATTYFSIADEERFQDTVLLNIISGVQPQDVPKFQAILPTLKTWEEKVETLLSAIEDSPTKDFQRRAINECRARIESVIDYNPDATNKRRIESKVTLIRPKAVLLPDLENDYGLSRLCVHPTEVHFVDGDHRSMLEQVECADIINRLEEEAAKTGSKQMKTQFVNTSATVTVNGSSDKGKN